MAGSFFLCFAACAFQQSASLQPATKVLEEVAIPVVTKVLEEVAIPVVTQVLEEIAIPVVTQVLEEVAIPVVTNALEEVAIPLVANHFEEFAIEVATGVTLESIYQSACSQISGLVQWFRRMPSGPAPALIGYAWAFSFLSASEMNFQEILQTYADSVDPESRQRINSTLQALTTTMDESRDMTIANLVEVLHGAKLKLKPLWKASKALRDGLQILDDVFLELKMKIVEADGQKSWAKKWIVMACGNFCVFFHNPLMAGVNGLSLLRSINGFFTACDAGESLRGSLKPAELLKAETKHFVKFLDQRIDEALEENLETGAEHSPAFKQRARTSLCLLNTSNHASCAHLRRVASNVTHDEMDMSFEFFDGDGNGKITPTDFEKYEEEIQKRAGSAVKLGDMDHDGALNYTEYLMLESQFFSFNTLAVLGFADLEDEGYESSDCLPQDSLLDEEEPGQMNTNIVPKKADSLTTFGSPGIATESLSFGDGIGGARIFTCIESRSIFFGKFLMKDPVTFIAGYHALSSIATHFKHGRHRAIGAGVGILGKYWVEHDLESSAFVPHRGGALIGPKGLELHSIKAYNESLESHDTILAVNARPALLASHLAYFSSEEAAIEFDKNGWKLVASVETRKNAALWLNETDNVHLAKKSGNCLLAFMGTNFMRQWTRYNLRGIVAKPVSWCGLDGVYPGFVHSLKNMANEMVYQKTMKPALAECKTLEVTGHSLGGARAALFTACVNNNLSPTDVGFKDQRWLR